MENSYYLYRHIRPDKNKPFYIGIGTKGYKKPRKVQTEYLRAYTTIRRNNIWNKIVKLNDGNYIVDIMLESNDYDFIKSKEVEFIKLYGRINVGNGILSNLTDGGEDICGNKRIVYVYDANGLYYKKYNSIREAGRDLDIPFSNIVLCCSGKISYVKSYIFKYNYLGDIITPIDRKVFGRKRVYRYDSTHTLVDSFESAGEAARQLNLKYKVILKCCNKQMNMYKGYMWSFNETI